MIVLVFVMDQFQHKSRIKLYLINWVSWK